MEAANEKPGNQIWGIVSTAASCECLLVAEKRIPKQHNREVRTRKRETRRGDRTTNDEGRAIMTICKETLKKDPSG